MNWVQLGRQARAIRIRQGLRQVDVGMRAGVSRSVVSLIERGHASRLAVRSLEQVAHAIGARFDPRLAWNGVELGRLTDARHAALAASVKHRLERWGWHVLVEVSFSHYGERGRIDLLAWHPVARILLVIEIKTDLIDVQALLGAMDVKARLAPMLAARHGWDVRSVVPVVVFLEDRTTRRRIEEFADLFDRYSLRGKAAISWARRPVAAEFVPSGMLWFRALPTARPIRISGERVRPRHLKRPS